MSKDVVERLRACAGIKSGDPDCCCQEAADEIERLRSERWGACPEYHDMSDDIERLRKNEELGGPMTVYLAVDRRQCDGAIQLQIGVRDEDGGGHGYRIAGPKYNGDGHNLLWHQLTERDIDVIRSYLRTAKAALRD